MSDFNSCIFYCTYVGCLYVFICVPTQYLVWDVCGCLCIVRQPFPLFSFCLKCCRSERGKLLALCCEFGPSLMLTWGWWVESGIWYCYVTGRVFGTGYKKNALKSFYRSIFNRHAMVNIRYTLWLSLVRDAWALALMNKTPRLCLSLVVQSVGSSRYLDPTTTAQIPISHEQQQSTPNLHFTLIQMFFNPQPL